MNEDQSLILGSGAQLPLIEVDASGVPATAYGKLEAAGRYTGERLFFSNPRLYHAVVALLGRGLPYREIAEICGVGSTTVCGVAAREGIPIETLRERIGRLGMDVASMTMECIRDLLADPDWRKQATMKDLAIVHGIAFTNAQLAVGGATSRMDFGDKVPAPGHEDYERFVRNVTGTGLSAENPAQKGALPAPVEPAIDVPTSTPGQPPKSASS